MLPTADNGEPPAEEKGRQYTMLENNPSVMTELALRLGLSKELAFYDVYSVYDDDLLAMIPRPCHALLLTVPLTEPWRRDREAEDSQMEYYRGAGPEEPVIWFRQTIRDGCGLIGLIHCASNGIPSSMIAPGSLLERFIAQATPLNMLDRAKLLHDSDEMYEASEAIAPYGDTAPVELAGRTGNHFLALVKGNDGHLWELEGSRKGPLDRGALGTDEDVLSETALKAGVRRFVEIQQKAGGEDSSLSFSCIALAPSMY